MLYFVGREWKSSEISFGKWAKRISKTILMILPIDLYHTAVMLSLRKIKSFVFARQASH